MGYAPKVIGECTIFPSSYMIPTRSCRWVYLIDAFLWPLTGKGGSSVGLRCTCVIWKHLWRLCAPTSGHHPGSNFLTYVSCFTFYHFPMFPSCALCFIFSLSQTPQLPSTLVYCTSLIVLRSHSHIPFRRIRSLVYISPVLVATNLRTNVPSEHSETPVRLWPS